MKHCYMAPQFNKKLSVLFKGEQDAHTCWFAPNSEIKEYFVGDFWVCMSTAGSSIRAGQGLFLRLCRGPIICMHYIVIHQNACPCLTAYRSEFCR